METIDVRELKVQTDEITRRVQEEHETYEITHHGRAFARVVPVWEPETASSPKEFWAEFDRAAAAIGSYRPEGVTPQEAIREERRELLAGKR